MPTLLVRCSAPELSAPKAVADPPWWTRLARAIAAEYRARHAMRRLHGLNESMLRDLGLDPGGVEHAVRFGRD